jgi:hypothetical protein
MVVGMGRKDINRQRGEQFEKYCEYILQKECNKGDEIYRNGNTSWDDAVDIVFVNSSTNIRFGISCKFTSLIVKDGKDKKNHKQRWNIGRVIISKDDFERFKKSSIHFKFEPIFMLGVRLSTGAFDVRCFYYDQLKELEAVNCINMGLTRIFSQGFTSKHVFIDNGGVNKW